MSGKITAKRIFFVTLDVSLFFLLCSSMLVFYKHVEPTRRGFFCADTSIRKPYLDSSVSAAVAASVGIGINVALIFLVETMKYLRRNNENNVYSRNTRTPTRVSCVACSIECPINLPRRIMRLIFLFMFGAAVTAFLTDIMKFSLGRLRPHFLDICNPDWGSFNCTDKFGLPVFVTDYKCRGNDDFKLKDARLSFPSGHASFSLYAMLMAIFYINQELRSPGHNTFMKPVLQLIFFCLALVTGLSRISDYKHHWSDVLAGFAVGTTIASVFYRFFLLKEKYVPSTLPHQNGGPKGTDPNDNNKLFAQENV